MQTKFARPALGLGQTKFAKNIFIIIDKCKIIFYNKLVTIVKGGTHYEKNLSAKEKTKKQSSRL